MRFEVNVDDGAGLDALHKARAAYNALHAAEQGFTPADDMPTFVQRMMDQAVGQALEGLGTPTTLSAALTKISELEADKATLEQEIAARDAAPAEQVDAVSKTA